MIEAIFFDLLVATVVFVSVFTFINRKQKLSAPNGKPSPPSLPSFPIIGSLPYLLQELDSFPHFLLKTSKRLGPVFSFDFLSKRIVVLSGKKAVIDGLLKHAETFADRPTFWFEANLLNPDERGTAFSHYDQRCKYYQKLFVTIMKEFGLGVSHESDHRIWHEVEPMLEKIRKENGQPFNPRNAIMHPTANVMMNILFGQEFQSENGDVVQKIVKGAHDLVENIDFNMELMPFLRFLPYYRNKINNLKTSQKMLMEGLEKAIRYNEIHKPVDGSFTNRFLEYHNGAYDYQDLLYMLRDVCEASSDTVPIAVLWLIIEMANHPESQVRIQKEIDERIPRERLPSYSDRQYMPYTEAVILEVARIHEVAPFGILHATTKDSEVCGYFVSKGSVVIASLYSIHKDTDLWTDPENFRPERFLDKDLNLVGRENVVQFGIGKRSCPGESIARQEVFIFMCSILQHFNILSPEGQDKICVVDEAGLTVGPSAFKVRFVPRKLQH